MSGVPRADERLRVALVAGTLARGGAEKQLVYMACALREAGTDVRVYSLTRGEHYEETLRRAGVPLAWIGRMRSRAARVLVLTRALRDHRPHIVQATHFFAGAYALLAARPYRALPVGSLRNDARHEVEDAGAWGRWLLRRCPALLANSEAARRNAEALGAARAAVHVLPNVIDVAAMDRTRDVIAAVPGAGDDGTASGGRLVVAVGRLVSQKRLDRFLRALALARRDDPALRGVVVGDGPERSELEALARRLGLLPGAVAFLGRRDDVPALLRAADVLVLTSDHEGSPNVVLEAMACRRPVVTTPAGEAGAIVVDGETGYVVPFDDLPLMAERLVRLAGSPSLRSAFGEAGRRRVERCYSVAGLADALMQIYRAMAERQDDGVLLTLLAGRGASVVAPGQ